MRLSADSIRQGVLHPEQLVREFAVNYFSQSASDDPDVMPLAIEAIETHGWGQAFESLACLDPLAQTDQTLPWFIDQVNRLGRPRAQVDRELCTQLSRTLARADVSLLMKYEEQVLGLEGMPGEYRDEIAQRLQLLTADTATCWDQLEELAQATNGQPRGDQVNACNRLAEAIGRDEDSADRVLAILSQKSLPANRAMEPLAIQLAGELRLEAALPMLIARLREDGGHYVNTQCVQTFIKIGSDAVVESICKHFENAPRHFKQYGSGALTTIRCASVAPECLALWNKEKDAPIRRNLIAAVLGAGCTDGLDPARQIVLKGDGELRPALLALALLASAPLPELPRWLEDERKQALLRKAHRDEPPPPPAQAQTTSDRLARPTSLLPPAGKHVGRNDPCPCGSGRKFKKCCMDKKQS